MCLFKKIWMVYIFKGITREKFLMIPIAEIDPIS